MTIPNTSYPFPTANGAILIDGASGPQSTTLTPGANVTITNLADAIQISATGTTGDTKLIKGVKITTTDATPTVALSWTPPDNSGTAQIWGSAFVPATGVSAIASNGFMWAWTRVTFKPLTLLVGANTAGGPLSANSINVFDFGWVGQAVYQNASITGPVEIVVTGAAATTIEWRFEIQYSVA